MGWVRGISIAWRIGIEPVAIHVDSIDFAWCRDVLVHVDDHLGGLEELHCVMAPDARLLDCSFVTDRLDGADLEMMLEPVIHVLRKET